MKRVLATHVYGFLKCPRAVELELHGDRDKRRPLTEAEELLLRRGRELEERFVAGLDYAQPEHDVGDFETGAAATLALLHDGVAGVHQGVLSAPPRLGIPDLLRREDGASVFGDHHYVVGDVKSSARPRGDQILQVAFYHRLLTELQQREPAYAYLVLKDGREERFDPRDFAPALDEVQARVTAIAAGEATERAFLSSACTTCRWWPVCEEELASADDLSLLQGMTRGLRSVLEAAGFRNCAAVARSKPETVAKRTHLEPALLRRLKRAAQARQQGRPLFERRHVESSIAAGAVVHLLTDGFEDRVLYFGVRTADGGVHEALPATASEELPAFQRLIDALPEDVALLHFGGALPHWLDGAAWNRPLAAPIEERFVDVARRLRGAAVYPAPVFGMDGYVRHGLGVDPHRFGQASAAAVWAADAQRLRDKGRADLEDLARLCAEILHGSDAGVGEREGELRGSVP